MADVVLVEIGDVRIHRVVVELHVGVGFYGFEPRVLHGDVVDSLRWSAFLLARFERPVVPIVADRSDDLLARDDLERFFQVLHKPVLSGDCPGRPARIVLVVVHQDEPVGNMGDRAVVKFLVIDRHGDKQLESLGLQIAVQLLYQRLVVVARSFRKSLDVERNAPVLIGCEKVHQLLAEALPRRRIGQELGGHVGLPLVAHGIEIVHQREHIHLGLF